MVVMTAHSCECNLMPLSYIPKNSLSGIFYVICIFYHEKNIEKHVNEDHTNSNQKV